MAWYKCLTFSGGLFENIDFTMNYEPLMESAMKFDFGEYNIYTMGGSTGGPVLGLILSILKGKFWLDSQQYKAVNIYID